ncbi:hypothetical protein [Microvirga thermotolerans]|uniref:Uncharacterized protein n=1 Tax=Microvirga thermotolerans TaxID=2651334 RepID=A0A5P9JYT8_9HYPH|nr:hypothetical protein [Microvirga thermotolerans]QFU16580.1 hypothetical protein GDR74_10260 [Microvirga thermotolerans]
MTEGKKRIFTRAPGSHVIVRKSDKGTVFSAVKAPGVGRFVVLDRDVFEKAARSAGAEVKRLKAASIMTGKPDIGKPTLGTSIFGKKK